MSEPTYTVTWEVTEVTTYCATFTASELATIGDRETLADPTMLVDLDGDRLLPDVEGEDTEGTTVMDSACTDREITSVVENEGADMARH